MKRVLVTGAAGFIGWKVCEMLLAEGYSVVGVDNLNDAYDVRLKQWRLDQLEGKPGFTFHLADLCNRAVMEALFAGPGFFHAVIHLGARAGVRPSVEDPWAYVETNVTGTLNVLELCRRHGSGKFVLASTSSLYGNGPRPFREDQPTDRPLSPYAASKKAAEALCHSYHHLYGLDVTVLRYFTVYGPAGRPDMSIFRFVRWIAEGEPVVLHGDGSQERDFTYVDDIARGTLKALRPVGYEVINLGSDRPVPLQRVLSLLCEKLGQEPVIMRRPLHPADVRATWADVGKARAQLGWEPETSLEDGLSRTVDWYLRHQGWVRKVALP